MAKLWAALLKSGGACLAGIFLFANAPYAFAQSKKCVRPALRFCDGCNLQTEWKITPATTCTVRTNFPNGVISITVTQKARQGVAVTSSNSWGYRSNADFKGPDSFAIELKYNNRVGGIERTNISFDIQLYR